MKKLILGILSAVCLAACASALAACGTDRPLHIWSEDWSYNAESHWHACTDAGCPGKDANEYHKFDLIKTNTPASCSAEGEGVYKCSVCDYTKTDVIEKLEHQWEFQSFIQKPTCYTIGRGVYTCSECGTSEEQSIPETGEHVFSTTSYGHDSNYHWRTCTTPGCTAISEKTAHTEGSPVTVQPSGWNDGSITYSCSACRAEMRSEAIPNPKAPVQFDLGFRDSATHTEIQLVSRGAENGAEAFNLTMVAGRDYTILLKNAKNYAGASLNLSGDDMKFEPTTLRGIKLYYVNDRNAETLIDEVLGEHIFKDGDLVRPRHSGDLKIVLRFETGINDENYHNRNIRVTKILYLKVLPGATTASAEILSAPAILPTTAVYTADYEDLSRKLRVPE